MKAEPRETSGSTLSLLLRFVREQQGELAVSEVLEQAGVTLDPAGLENSSCWVSYDTRVRLFEAATVVLGDQQTMFKVGANATAAGLHPAMVPLLRAFGSPQQVYRHLPQMVPKFTSTSTMTVVDCTTTTATIHFRLHDGYPHSRLDCEYAQGLVSAVPQMFGLPAAKVEHHECQSDGHPACVYQLSWSVRQPWWSLRGRLLSPERGLEAVQVQLREFQLAAADLVSSDDV